MNKKIYFLPLLMLLLVLTSCEETKEASNFDNWKPRNVAFMDSLQNVYDTAPNHGGLQRFAPETNPEVMVYYKDITPSSATVTDRSPLYTESVNYFYRGTYIFGEPFDNGNFSGTNPDPDFETPSTSAVNIFVDGFTYGLQNMKEGQRWILYLPYEAGYGDAGKGDIPGYSTLIFDLTLVSIAE